MEVTTVGNLCSYLYHGYEYDENFSQEVSMQWHITVSCDQKCKHCYMFNGDEYISQRDNQLTKEQSFRLVDEFVSLLIKLNTGGSISITGGDPLLSDNFWDILEYVANFYGLLNIDIIMGNSYHIDRIVAKRLKTYGVNRYQISIDGLENTHDYIRKPGSFQDALRALECLHNEGIQATTMTTVSKKNCDEVIPLYKYLSSLDFITTFSLDRMIPVGNGKTELKEGIVDKDEYQKMMYDLFTYEVVENKRKILAYKDKLWRPLFHHMGLTDPIKNKEKKYWSICPAGGSAFCVLSDGSVYACRRLDKRAGKFPEESLADVFFNSHLFHSLRNPQKETSCNNCNLKWYCNGCPAMKYAVNGHIGGSDPTCHYNQS